jgi:hypothetical protein
VDELMPEGLKLPTWELAKEIADTLPSKGNDEGEACRECGKPYEDGDEKSSKWAGKR